MKKQKMILLVFLIPVLVAILFSCGTQRNAYGCPKSKEGNWHGRQNITVLNDSYSYPDCVESRENPIIHSEKGSI